MRIGFGYDVHAFEEGEYLTLGGVQIPYKKKFKAHSDGDVLLHAICDALLGALALGDIGKHFPDTDPKYKGINSRELLLQCYELIVAKGFKLANLDATVALERPKLRPFIDDMRANIASDLNVSIEQVSVKATTTEKLGFVGEENGVEAYANVLLVKEL